MNRSRCRPREDDVKFVRQYGHVLSFDVEGLAGVPDSAVEPGVAIETSAMIAREEKCAMRVKPYWLIWKVHDAEA